MESCGSSQGGSHELFVMVENPDEKMRGQIDDLVAYWSLSSQTRQEVTTNVLPALRSV